MALVYVQSNSDHLRQGEILEGVVEYRPVASSDSATATSRGVELIEKSHPLAIVVSQDCDLEWDHGARFRPNEVKADKLLQHVLFCDLYPEDEIRNRSDLKTDQFKRVRQNQDERYHRFDEAGVNPAGEVILELYADFKQVFSLPTEFAYALVSAGHVRRRGVLPSPYLQDFTHRLFGFLGRVAIPEAD